MVGIQRLPVELLLMVAEEAREGFDGLKTLRRVDRRFCAIVEPLLFNTVVVDSQETKRSSSFELLAALSKGRSSHISYHVRKLVIRFFDKSRSPSRFCAAENSTSSAQEFQKYFDSQISKAVGSLEKLKSLHVLSGSESLSPASIWPELQQHNITLQQVVVWTKMERPFLEYLDSFSGIEDLVIWGAWGSSDDNADRDLASYFVHSVLPRHRETLRSLTTTAAEEGPWSLGRHNVDEYAQCKGLRSLSVSINSEDVGVADSQGDDILVGAMASVEIPPNIAHVTGPLLLGFLLNYGFFGILSVQVYTYHEYFPNDQWYLKLLVYALYFAEAIQSIMITSDAFEKFAYGFGNVPGLDQMNLLWFDCCIIDGAVAFSVQLYFAYRLYLLTKSQLLSGAIVIMALAQFSGAIATGILAQMAGLFSLIRERCFVAAVFWLGGSAACDIVIAVAMTWALSRYNSKFQESGDLVRRLIRLTMETGSLTATIAFVDLVLYLNFPDNAYHITPALALAKLYSNSLMVVLNSRPGARNHHARETMMESRRSSKSSLELTSSVPHSVPASKHSTALHPRTSIPSSVPLSVTSRSGHDTESIFTQSTVPDLVRPRPPNPTIVSHSALSAQLSMSGTAWTEASSPTDCYGGAPSVMSSSIGHPSRF
ncbi:hypothetical protein V5O48_008833 [Marasmius crinis-equi]|uniref:DUF6534 domain-containing protein n=1 Tax=Marasmius crinis-equi TaxID=585013 RepID=A0ABR3FCX2_9AGAR